VDKGGRGTAEEAEWDGIGSEQTQRVADAPQPPNFKDFVERLHRANRPSSRLSGKNSSSFKERDVAVAEISSVIQSSRCLCFEGCLSVGI
jgi:hypothetical protein